MWQTVKRITNEILGVKGLIKVTGPSEVLLIRSVIIQVTDKIERP